jgi:hypothetical protein
MRNPEIGDFKRALPILHSCMSIILLRLTQQNANTYMQSRVVEDTNMKKKR